MWAAHLVQEAGQQVWAVRSPVSLRLPPEQLRQHLRHDGVALQTVRVTGFTAT